MSQNSNYARERNPQFNEDAILVTGGSGFIGRELVNHLSVQNRPVVCMYHHRLPEPKANVFPVCSDMSSAELLAAPLRGVNTIIHLAWQNNFTGPKDGVDWNGRDITTTVNITMINNLIKAAEQSQTKRFIFVSAMGASRNSAASFLQEKYLAEFMVLNSRIPEKVIIRPTIICGGGGNHDKFLRSMLNLLKYPAVYPLPDSISKPAPLHVNDIVQCIARLSKADLKENNLIFEMRGKESFELNDMFKMVSNRFAKGAKIPLRGAIGRTLLPIFEKEKNHASAAIKMRDFLQIVQQPDEDLSFEDADILKLTKPKKGFSDILSENMSA